MTAAKHKKLAVNSRDPFTRLGARFGIMGRGVGRYESAEVLIEDLGADVELRWRLTRKPAGVARAFASLAEVVKHLEASSI